MTTKVYDKVSHKTSQKDSVPCAKGKLKLIQCKSEDLNHEDWLLKNKLNPDRIVKPVYGGEYRRMQQNGFIPVKPIIISETEKIEDGDWFIDIDGIWQRKNYYSLPVDAKKILVLSKNFSPKHIQSIIDGKLKDGNDVLVECESEYCKVEDMDIRGNNHKNVYSRIKLNSQNFVSLHKPEEFTPSEQEAIQRFQSGEKWSVSTFIDEDTITAGYGKSGSLGDFEFPLPAVYIKHIYGTTSWETKHKHEEEKRIKLNRLSGDFISLEEFKTRMGSAYWHGDMSRIENKTSMDEFDEWFKNQYPKK